MCFVLKADVLGSESQLIKSWNPVYPTNVCTTHLEPAFYTKGKGKGNVKRVTIYELRFTRGRIGFRLSEGGYDWALGGDY